MLLVDTVATLTIRSNKMLENVHGIKAIELKSVTQKIVVADGTPLQVQSKCAFKYTLEDHITTFEAIVAHIGVNGILGLDFLKQNKCLVSVSLHGKMYVGGIENELQLEGHLGCFRVSLQEIILIPPRRK